MLLSYPPTQLRYLPIHSSFLPSNSSDTQFPEGAPTSLGLRDKRCVFRKGPGTFDHSSPFLSFPIRRGHRACSCAGATCILRQYPHFCGLFSTYYHPLVFPGVPRVLWKPDHILEKGPAFLKLSKRPLCVERTESIEPPISDLKVGEKKAQVSDLPNATTLALRWHYTTLVNKQVSDRYCTRQC